MHAPSPVRKNLFPVGVIGLPGIAARTLFGAMPGFRGASQNRVVPTTIVERRNLSPAPGPPCTTLYRSPLQQRHKTPTHLQTSGAMMSSSFGGASTFGATSSSLQGPQSRTSPFAAQQEPLPEYDTFHSNMFARTASSALMEGMLQRKSVDQRKRTTRFDRKRDLIERVASNQAIRERLSQALNSGGGVRLEPLKSTRKTLTRYQKSWSDQADDLLRALKSPERRPEDDEEEEDYGDDYESEEEERRRERKERRRRRRRRRRRKKKKQRGG